MGWKVIGPILQLIYRLLDWFDKQQRVKDYEDRQDKRDKAKDNPRDAFDLHFNGRVLADKTDDAETASQADPGSDGKPEG